METFIYLRTSNSAEYLNQLTEINTILARPCSFVVINEHQEVISDSGPRREIKLLDNPIKYNRLKTYIVVYRPAALFIGKNSLYYFLTNCDKAGVKIFSFKEPDIRKIFDLDEVSFEKELKTFLDNIPYLVNDSKQIIYKPKTGITIPGYPKKH